MGKEQPELSRGGNISQDTKHFQDRGNIEVGANETEKVEKVTRHKDDKKWVKVAKGHLNDKMEESDLGGNGNDRLSAASSPSSSRNLPPRTAPGRRDQPILSLVVVHLPSL